jgi:hypothetical protein
MSKATDNFERCINLDWLEVTALEPITQPHDAEYFRACDFIVIEREYGTRVWSQMFTLEGTDHLPFLEVRRSPKSEIIAANVCHLRLVNRVCYFPNAVQLMTEFLDRYGYEFQRICRVDVCLDFERFDYGDYPKDFVRRFMQGKYSKINQANISAHGSDDWAGRVWNSLSWGSPSSDIGTKFYCKTLELYDPVTKHYGKPYIRQAWQACGLVDDAVAVTKTKPSGEVYTPEIWRVEFSIRSSVKNWFLINLDGKAKKKQSIRNTLDMYDNREKLLVIFASLADHYFHFKHLIKRYNFYTDGKSDGYALRKDRCPDKLLFNWRSQVAIYKVAKESVATSEKVDTTLARLLSQLKQFRDTTHDVAIRKSATVIIDYLENQISHYDQSNPINRHDMLVMQRALRDHIATPWIDPAILIRLAREEMNMRDEINPFL